MRELREQRITAPGTGGDGLGMSDGQSWLVEDSLIDMSACPLEGLDEAVGVTWGSRALFRRCRIRGAGKLLLCGSGDADKLAVERGRVVIFEDCILEDFGRRGPEAQSGMRVILRRCLIRNWGEPGRFDVRAFAAWAHHGGRIEAYACVFDQPRFWRGWRLMARDWLAHLGQAWNDEGLRGLLRPANWLPGVCRGLTATAGGHVRAENCRATRWWIRLEGHHGPRMSRAKAQALMDELADKLPYVSSRRSYGNNISQTGGHDSPATGGGLSVASDNAGDNANQHTISP